MFIPVPGRQNWIAYYLWRWILRNDGEFCAYLDKKFFGPLGGLLNNYDELASQYKNSDIKPDKRYSILPTVRRMVGDCDGKVVSDLGCGAGFFTREMVKMNARVVYGIDNSKAQLDLAAEIGTHPIARYRLLDVFTEQLPSFVDIVAAPFIINYARTTPILRFLLSKIYGSLNDRGKAVFVLDLPNGKSLKRFGAIKTLCGKKVDETRIQISLFREEKEICVLNAVYYKPETIEMLLQDVGFRNIIWHKPIVSEDGVDDLGSDFWKGYLEDPELGYLTAEKVVH